jgi:hypothetical protein
VRLAARVTLAEAAAPINTAAATLWRWENYSRTPRAAKALAYARVLECLERGLKP